MFKNSYFIKPRGVFNREFSDTNPSPVFYKSFNLEAIPTEASLYVCALGIGYAYINGNRVSEDLFTPPPSDYETRLWYTSYDVKHLLRKGENLILIHCGNGFLNEDMKNGWSSTEAPWRDFPKVIAELCADGEPIAVTDDSWSCAPSPYVMNRYRMGVTYDARIPAPSSYTADSDNDSLAVRDGRAPRGAFTLYNGEPIREWQTVKHVNVTRTGPSTRVYDFGITISGYARILVRGNSGDVITLRYSENMREDGSLYTEREDTCFLEGEFAKERYICNGTHAEWSTLFSYYGFRYIEVHCENESALESIEAVFVTQTLRSRASFESSDPFLNKLYECGIRATRSNMFYLPTDCPTREKYGWMNDAQSSSEQILTNFHAESMFSWWNVNICDAFKDEKGLPGIVPTHGWGYDWGNGPVSDGSLFEHVYRVYLHSGNADGLMHNLPYFRRYLAFLKGKEDMNGCVEFGLNDWANPYHKVYNTPLALINAIYRVKFNKIAALAARLAGEDEAEFIDEEARQRALIKKYWMLPDGRCAFNEQTALSMLIYHGIYEDLAPLKEQLKSCVEAYDYHHTCGMVGLRHLYMALNICGLQEYAMRIVTAHGFPSYREWIDRGATTLWETWTCTLSKNHHMYSDVLSWLMKTVVGISPDDRVATFETITVKPYFFADLEYAKGHYDSPRGRVSVEWRRTDEGISLDITAPCDGYVRYGGELIGSGKTTYIIPRKEI